MVMVRIKHEELYNIYNIISLSIVFTLHSSPHTIKRFNKHISNKQNIAYRQRLLYAMLQDSKGVIRGRKFKEQLEMIEDIKVVIRSRKSKDRQHSAQQKTITIPNNDLQNIA
jgi:hypothetical protein